jgi:hypothetical protein
MVLCEVVLKTRLRKNSITRILRKYDRYHTKTVLIMLSGHSISAKKTSHTATQVRWHLGWL